MAMIVEAWVDPTDGEKYLIIKHQGKPELPIKIKDPNFNNLFSNLYF